MTHCAAARGQPPLPFRSILGIGAESDLDLHALETPAFFSDLNLGQIVEAITAGREEYNLTPRFYQRLGDLDAIHYRHEVFRDLEDEGVLAPLCAFAQRMRDMRKHIARAEKLYYKYQKDGWLADAVEIYCQAVEDLCLGLSQAEVRSRGLLAFRQYLASYVESPTFTALVAETATLKRRLSQVTYCLLIKGNRVSVQSFDAEAEYSTEVLQTFERFKQGGVKDYLTDFTDGVDMNHVEANILDLVAKLFKDVFLELDDYCDRNRDYRDDIISNFDREVQFYISYLEYIQPLQSAGLHFCYPEVSGRSKEIFANETFDVALAQMLAKQGSTAVCNDFYLREPERIFVVSGPNQGGKTTFARTIGQLHHLASLGCPVPGSASKLLLCDQIFTHFERQEDVVELRGKLEEDLVRIRGILDQATGDSLVIMNEIFTSTTLSDALLLSKKVVARVVELDLICVYVTFIDEVASLAPSTVSMVSTVVAENPAQRTYKLVRRPADGLSYALAIAQKYDLTYERLRQRIG